MPSSTCIRKRILKMEHHTKSPRQIQRKQITKEVHRIFLESRCLYESPKVTSVLRQKEKQLSQKNSGENHERTRLTIKNCKKI